MIPTKWDQVSTRQYMRYAKTLKTETTTAIESIDLLIERTCILANITEDEAIMIPLIELDKIKKLIATPLPTKIYKEFKIGGVWYEFILNPKEVSAEQFAGIKEAIKKDIDQGYAMTLYYLARPFKNGLRKKYIDTPTEDVPDIIESFHNLPITVSYPIVVFFCRFSKEFKSYSLDYLKNETKKAKTKMLKEVTNLAELTVGSKP